jgi:hypothetical protein
VTEFSPYHCPFLTFPPFRAVEQVIILSVDVRVYGPIPGVEPRTYTGVVLWFARKRVG